MRKRTVLFAVLLLLTLAIVLGYLYLPAYLEKVFGGFSLPPSAIRELT